MNGLKFHLLDIQNDDINYEFQITLYGKTHDNKNIICNVTGFKPYFYVKIRFKSSYITNYISIVNRFSI